MSNNNVSLYICNSCQWIHTGISREDALRKIEEFNIYFDNLPGALQAAYYSGKKASLEDYSTCNRCSANWRMFRKYNPDSEFDRSILSGNAVTVNPILID